MKRFIAYKWVLIWLAFSILYDLGSQWYLQQSNPNLTPHTLPLWILLPGYLIWAALTVMALKSASRQTGRGTIFAILLLVLWGFLFVSLTVQGYFFWTAFLPLGKGLMSLYTLWVTATPGFFHLDAALLVIFGLFRLIKGPRATL
ncbi:MAG: hypothetical protein VB013_06415 [Anaerolineaceae bacterium]|nr:hypothetical protein [Anaerolineaceae bacterium]